MVAEAGVSVPTWPGCDGTLIALTGMVRLIATIAVLTCCMIALSKMVQNAKFRSNFTCHTWRLVWHSRPLTFLIIGWGQEMVCCSHCAVVMHHSMSLLNHKNACARENVCHSFSVPSAPTMATSYSVSSLASMPFGFYKKCKTYTLNCKGNVSARSYISHMEYD